MNDSISTVAPEATAAPVAAAPEVPAAPVATADTTSQVSAAPVAVAPVAPAPPRRQVTKPSITRADSAFFGLTEQQNAENFIMSTAGEGRAENPMRSTPYLKEKADTARQFTFSTHREVQAAPIMPHKELGTTAVGSDTGWIFLIVTILAVLIGAVRFRTVAFFTSLSMAFTSDIYWRTLNNSLNMQFYWTSRFAFILAQAVVTVLIYELVLSTGVTELWGLSHFALFCLIAVAYIVYQLLKLALDRTIGFAFDCSNDMAQILQGKLLTGTLFGLTVLPVVIVFPFVGERFYILLAIIALIMLITTYVVGTLKSLKTISIDGISLFYGILYLCGVEITPLLFIVRALQIG